MDADLDTLATALYVKIHDLLKAAPQWAPARPPVGIAPKLSDDVVRHVIPPRRRHGIP